MEKQEFVKKFSAGLFFVLGMGLILFVIFMIGKNKGFAQPKFHVSVLFSDVGGLIEGAPVQLAGVGVGTVADVDFLDQAVQGRRVRVRLSIFNKYKSQLNRNIQFTIKNAGILGEKLVEIHVNDSGQVTDLSRPVIGKDLINVQDLAAVFVDAAQAFTRTSNDFSQVDVQALSKVLAEAAQSLSDTSKGVNQVLTEMQYISIKSKRLLDRIEQRIIDGNLFKMF